MLTRTGCGLLRASCRRISRVLVLRAAGTGEKKTEIWEDPWSHIRGDHLQPSTSVKLTDYVESAEEFKYVEDLLPLERIPEVPRHEKFPTPSGWYPPNRKHFLCMLYLRLCFSISVRFHFAGLFIEAHVIMRLFLFV